MDAPNRDSSSTPVGDTSKPEGVITARESKNAVNADKASARDAEAMASSFLRSMGQSLKHSADEHSSRSAQGVSAERRSPRRSTGRSPSRHRSGSNSGRRRNYSRDERHRDYERRRADEDRSRSYRQRSRSRDGRRSRSRHGYRRSRESSRRHDEEVIPLHLRPKRLSFWDLPPPGFENVSCLEAKASGLFPPPGQAAGSRNVASFNPSVLFEHTHRNENDRFRPSSRGEREFPSTASRQARRLYVGNIPYGIDEDSIASFFNDLLVRLNIAPPNELPVQNIQINVDKNYAFVELRDADQATMGMGLDGVMFQNQKLKIRRPKDYIPPPGQSEPKPPALNVSGLLSNTVPDSPNKVYVGGLPSYLGEEQVMELLRAFGELKAFNLVKDNTMRLSRGFAFCEYMDPNVTDIACQGLNGMELGDKRLVVQRASIGARGGNQPQRSQQPQQPHQNSGYPYPQGQQQQTGGIGQYGHGPDAMGYDSGYAQTQMGQHPPPSYAQLPNVGGQVPVAHGQQLSSAQATPIVQLLNMVTENELLNDEEYEDIVDDVRDECANYGSVVELRIPRHDQNNPEEKVAGVGKIFVKYTSAAEATVALNALAGRQFMGRTVIASYISEEDFANRNY
ncbi:hypothetical protein GGI25_002329 [Coemansia spiralis]|uniref:RRM domain-containing protein n=2 Tax=Coemansia TaxID=4863 RepID=A0A9W8KYP0_9FUNG|nr:hypothetical protein BX070DRAFT_80090 [Coemansia spiralis]KAJ1989567.1 hypothetical protein EDC05_004601 [Coemansia umbellata]KAJ2625717.1 hypothetical protein GGI26_000517 [Coemansia sp. RSA 1358]KAJ2678535.1 hypothetical protein GGI25_002329 [Coemansia spiralis]